MNQTTEQCYLLQYRVLKFHKKHGTKVKKLHFNYQFKQSPWLTFFKNYIADQGAKTNTRFEKFSYNFLISDFHRKPINSIRKCMNSDLIDKTDRKKELLDNQK